MLNNLKFQDLSNRETITPSYRAMCQTEHPIPTHIMRPISKPR